MELTKEGIAIVETAAFAKTAHDYLSPWREQKVSDTELADLVTSLVAWAATGHDLNQSPVGRQAYELAAFVLGHLKEVSDLRDVVAKNMLNFQLRS